MLKEISPWPSYHFQFLSMGDRIALKAYCADVQQEVITTGQTAESVGDAFLEKLIKEGVISVNDSEAFLFFSAAICRARLQFEKQEKAYKAAKEKYIASKAITEQEVSVDRGAASICVNCGAKIKSNDDFCEKCSKGYQSSFLYVQKELYAATSTDANVKEVALLSIAFSLDKIARKLCQK